MAPKRWLVSPGVHKTGLFMPVVELTDRFCDRTKPGKDRLEYFDSKTHGLSLRIMPSGVKTFALTYGPRTKRSRLTLGRYPRLSLARARTVKTHATVEPPRCGIWRLNTCPRRFGLNCAVPALSSGG